MTEDFPAAHFVAWFRSVAPYVNLFRGKTFLIAFGGKAIAGPLARTLAYDVNLLAALGVRLVLVHGARPQIEKLLRERGLPSVYHQNYRVTDASAMRCVIDAVGSIYVEIEALLSQGLADTPMANSTIRVVGGNFITAKPVGVVNGVDLQYTGQVRKIDAEGIRAQLALGNIVLLSCLGSSPTGEIFNLAMEEVAEAVSTALLADKLIFLSDSVGATDIDGTLLAELTVDAAERLLSINDWLQRRTESLAYIYALRESIATGVPFDESSLWTRYKYPRLQQKYHNDNVALMKKEYEERLWTWDPDFLFDVLKETPLEKGVNEKEYDDEE